MTGRNTILQAGFWRGLALAIASALIVTVGESPVAIAADRQSAQAASQLIAPDPLEERCVAAGTGAPWELRAVLFNHHPERKNVPKPSERFYSPALVEADVTGLIQRMPDECGQFRRNVYVKAQFKATKRGGRWLATRRKWEGLELQRRSVGEAEDGKTRTSPLARFSAEQAKTALSVGCVTRARAVLKLEIVNAHTGDVIAVRTIRSPALVPGWFRARCLGKLSIRDATKRCRQSAVGGLPGSSVDRWRIRVSGFNCGRAAKIVDAALRATHAPDVTPRDRRVRGWRCTYGGGVGGRNGLAGGCFRRSGKIYFSVQGAAPGTKCPIPPDVVATAIRSTCLDAVGLVGEARKAVLTEGLAHYDVNGRAWTCSLVRRLSSSDDIVAEHICLSGRSFVTFAVRARALEVNPVGQPIAPDVIYPKRDGGFPNGSAPDSFRKTPNLTFRPGQRGSSRITIKAGKVMLELVAEQALIGRRARVTVKRFKRKCTWTADQTQTYPSCPVMWQVGKAVSRQIRLKSRQLIYAGRRHSRGNWLYLVRATTKPFASAGVHYTKASAIESYSLINKAANCQISAWCRKK